MLCYAMLSHFSRVRLCATPYTAAHQASLSLGFSRQEHWSGLPFPSPMQQSEKWKWSCSVVSDPQRPHGLQPSRLLHPWDLPGKSTGVGCHCLLWYRLYWILIASQIQGGEATCSSWGRHWSRREDVGWWCHLVELSMSQLPPLDGAEDGLYLGSSGGSDFLPLKTPWSGSPTPISPFPMFLSGISLPSSLSDQTTFPNFSFSI